MLELVANFAPSGDQPAAISQLVHGLRNGCTTQILLGVTGSGKTFTIAHVLQELQKPSLILAPNKTLAAQLYSEMRDFFPSNAVEYFVSYYDYYQPEAYIPASDTYIAKDAAINKQIEQMRLSATKALIERQDVIIVATVSAIYGLGDPKTYLSTVLHLKHGTRTDQQYIIDRLTTMQYTRNDYELERGTYRVRGEVIDIYPAESSKYALRVSMDDDEISKLTIFDPPTGKLLQTIQRFTIYPKSHYVTPHDTILAAIAEIRADLITQLAALRQADKLVAAERLEQRTLYDIEALQEMGYCTGIENYSRYLSGRSPGEPPPTLLDYLPHDGIVVIDESHVTIPQLAAMYRGDLARKYNLVNHGFRLPSALDNRPLNFAEFIDRSPPQILVSATPGKYELAHSQAIVEQIVRPTGLLDPKIEVRPATTQIDDLLSEINERRARNERVIVTTITKRLAEHLANYYRSYGIKVNYLHSDIGTVERVEIIRDLRLGAIEVIIGINLLREGLDMPEVSLVAILDADKEGFLRSTTSLIQTIGRVARNAQGTAILYADKITGAMQQAIHETERRRAKQEAYNHEHKITPATVRTTIKDLGVNTTSDDYYHHDIANAPTLSATALSDKITELQSIMATQVEQLEFERAAHTRDTIQYYRQLLEAK